MFTTLPLDRLIESPQNPRRHWNDRALDELVTSLRQVGVLTPLLVRPVPLDIVEDLGDDWLVMARHSGEVVTVCSSREQAETWRKNWLESDRAQFEIAAGHRRFRAAARADLAEVPVQIRDLGDREFLEILTIENLQREDVHPLDEAEGYAMLMASDGAYTVDAIAAKVGKSVSYVRQRLALRKLSAKAKEHFLRDEITAAHAVRLARLSEAQQRDALDEVVFLSLLSRTGGEKRLEVAPVSELDDWIAEHVRLDLHAPETAEQFPEVAAAVASAAVAGATILQLGNYTTKREKGGPLVPGAFRELQTKKDRCPHAQAGVFVVGHRRGRVVDVCATRSCAKHWPQETKASTTSKAVEASSAQAQRDQWKREQEQWERKRRVWEAAQPQIIDLIVEATRGTELTADMIVMCVTDEHRVEIAQALGVPSLQALQPSQFGQVLQLDVYLHEMWSAERAEKGLKPLGIDVKAIVKEADKRLRASEQAAAKAAAPAKSTKTAKASTTKGKATTKAAAARKAVA